VAGFWLENGPSGAHSQGMDDPVVVKMIGFLYSLCTAMMAALMLGYVAHFDFGISRLDIRMLALIGAATFASIFRKEPAKIQMTGVLAVSVVFLCIFSGGAIAAPATDKPAAFWGHRSSDHQGKNVRGRRNRSTHPERRHRKSASTDEKFHSRPQSHRHQTPCNPSGNSSVFSA
jgi:hypothetical protein